MSFTRIESNKHDINFLILFQRPLLLLNLFRGGVLPLGKPDYEPIKPNQCKWIFTRIRLQHFKSSKSFRSKNSEKNDFSSRKRNLKNQVLTRFSHNRFFSFCNVSFKMFSIGLRIISFNSIFSPKSAGFYRICAKIDLSVSPVNPFQSCSLQTCGYAKQRNENRVDSWHQCGYRNLGRACILFKMTDRLLNIWRISWG